MRVIPGILLRKLLLKAGVQLQLSMAALVCLTYETIFLWILRNLIHAYIQSALQVRIKEVANSLQ